MPKSFEVGKEQIKEYLQTKKYNKILDIGVGKGTYGILLDNISYLIGIDVIDYRETYEDIDKYYDEYYLRDMRDRKFIVELGYFDLIILGDVLEHISAAEAQECLKLYKEISNNILVAVPYEYKQIVKDNEYENHVQDDLTHDLFMERYEDFKLISSCNKNNKPIYGYYIWNKGD